jgi:copper resistance protein C
LLDDADTEGQHYLLALEPQVTTAYAFNTQIVSLEEIEVLISRWKYALLTVAIVLTAQLLFAHAVLMDSTPKQNSTVKGPDVDITLRYNVRIDGGRSRVELVAPDGKDTDLSLEKQPSPDKLQCKATGLKPGAYKLIWNVLASDGHMSKGEVPFTVQ